MGMLVLAGEMMNALSGATFGSSPSAHASFPFSELSDGDPGTIGKFGSLTADPFVYADIDILRGTGGAENFVGAMQVGWTKVVTGTATVTQEGTLFHSGIGAFRLSAGNGVASGYIDVEVRAGQKLFLGWWSRSDGAGGEAKIRVRNIHTGMHLKEDAGWTTSPVDLFPQTGTVYTEGALGFTVESMTACRQAKVTLRIQILEENASKVSYFDDIILVPYIDTCSIHGHNIDPRSSLTLQASDVFNSGYVSIATLDVRRRAFYQTFDEQAYRFWKLLFSETNQGSGAIWMAEWVLGKAHQLERGPNYPLRRTFADPRIQLARPVGAAGNVARGQFEQGTVPLTFRCKESQRLDFYNEVFVRSLGGHPAVVVPSTLDDEVFYGILAGEHGEEWQLRTASRGYLDYSTSIDELALPIVTG
jgi:hypothetical protein